MDMFAYPTDGIRMHLGTVYERSVDTYARDAAILLEIEKKRHRGENLLDGRELKPNPLVTRVPVHRLIKLVLKIARRLSHQEWESKWDPLRMSRPDSYPGRFHDR